MNWYFEMESEEYGAEEFGPYDTFEYASQGLDRVRNDAEQKQRKDSIIRWFTGPYYRDVDGTLLTKYDLNRSTK